MIVSGQITNETTGQPLPGALVQIADSSMNPLGKQSVTDAQGNFSIDTVNDLGYLLVSESGYNPIFISIADFSATMQASLQPSATMQAMKDIASNPLVIAFILGACYFLFFKKGKKKLGDVDYTDMLIKIGIPVAAYFVVVKPLLQNLGILKSGAASGAQQVLKEQDNTVASGITPFSPLFYQSAPAGAEIFTQAAADAIANEIYGSVGLLWDTPAQGVAAFNQCATQAQVSFVADRFNQLYQLDLYTWLRTKYDTDIQQELLQQIVQYVNSLPKYNT